MTTTTALLSPAKKPKYKKMPPQSTNLKSAPVDFGFIMSLPISNEENKKLEEQVNDQKFKLEKCQREVTSMDQSIQTMWQHLQNIRSDVEQNQTLFRAKDSSLETETRVINLTKLEVSKLQSDLKAKENVFKDVSDKQTRNQKLLDVKKKELEKIIIESGQSHEEFEAELEKVLTADDTNVTIQKDMIIEEHLTAEMSAKLEKLNDQCAKKRKELDSLETELKAIQLNLDKANADLQKEQLERQRLIQQCESTMGIWTKKENNFQSLEEQLTEYRNEGEVLQKSLKEKLDEVNSQHVTNKELMRKIAQSNDQLTKLKSELNKTESTRQQLVDEILGEKAVLTNAKSQQKTINIQLEQIRSDLNKNDNKLQQLKLNKETVIKNVEDAKGQHETNEEKIKRLNLATRHARDKKVMLDKHKSALMDLIGKKKDQILNGKKETRKLQKDVEGIKSTNRNLSSKLKQLEREGMKNQENIENKEAEIKRVERELELAAGSDLRTVDISTNTSTVALKKKLDRLKMSTMENEAALQTWESTLKKTESDLDKSRKDVSKVDQLKKVKEHALNGLQAETEKLEKSNKKLVEEKQDVLVQSNLLQVEIKRLTDTLNAKSEEVVSVGQEKESLSLALRTHQQEIRAKKDLLQVEYCQLEEERKKMSIQFKDLLNKIEQMKNRYDIYVISLRASEYEKDDREKYFVTKYEKEKEELTNISEELNTKIKKTEREVVALENTLKMITERNHSFRQGISQVDKNCPDYQEKIELESQYRALGDKYGEIMKEIKNSRSKIAEMEKDMGQISQQQSDVTSQIHLEHLAVEKLKQEISEQEQKLERWDKQTSKATEDFRKTRSAGKGRNVTYLIESDIDLQQQKMLSNAACKIIAVLSHRNPESADLITEEFRQYDLPLDFSIDSSATTTKRSETDSAISSQRSAPSASTMLVLKKVSLDAETLPRIDQKPSSAQKPWSKRTSQSLPRVSRK